MYTDQEMDDLLAKDNEKYRKLAEKSMCRLVVFGEGERGEGDNWILPWCIDTLRAYASRRKGARRKLNVLLAPFISP